MADDLIHVKLTVVNNKGITQESRRFGMPPTTNFIEVQQRVQDTMKSTEFGLTYRDPDGDMVSMGSEVEWKECLQVGSSYHSPRDPLRLCAKKRKCGNKRTRETTESPVVEVGTDASTFFYDSEGSVQQHEGRLDELKATVEKVLQPYGGQVPEFLKKAVKTLDDDQVDVSIPEVANALSQYAVSLMDEEKYDMALGHLLDSFALKPTQNTQYNIGCCYALLGDPTRSLEALTAAVDLGYTNGDHMSKDIDLISLRENPRFVELLRGLGASMTEVLPASAPTAPQPAPVPRPTPPPPVQQPKVMLSVAFVEALEVLHGMGFPLEAAKAALDQTEGDYRAAVDLLLA